LKLYNNGVLVATSGTLAAGSTGTTLNLQGLNAWGSDGQKTLVAQLIDNATGRQSLLSVPKSVTVDTQIKQGFSSFTVTSDLSPVGTLGAGDTVRIVFNEAVGLTVGSLPSAVFGTTGATVTAIGAVGGKSSTWDIKLGTGASFTQGADITFTGVSDAAGNSGTLVATIPAQLFDSPSAPSIANVTADNVINSAERGAAQTITIKLGNAKVGDVVKLFMDGVQLGSDVVVTSNGQATASVTVPVNGWGSDGTRYLSASVQRGSQAALTSAMREVYVAADGTHWSVAGGGTSAIWFDPNTLDASGVGQAVMSWASSVGGSTAGLASIASGTATDATRPTLVRVNGQQTLLFNGSQALNYNDPNGILWNASKINGMDITGFSAVTPTNLTGSYQAALAFWTNSSPGGSTGVKLGVGPNAALAYTNYAKMDFIGTSNSVSLNNATTLTLRSYINELNTYVLEGYNQNLLQLSTTGNNAKIDLKTAPTRLRIGADANQANISFTWQGYISDTIWLNYKATDALMQEVQVYLSAKYGASGALTTRVNNNTYDLSVSANNSLLLDDRLMLADVATDDTIVTAGADYVIAGQGKDKVQIKDLSFRTLDGGFGADTLQLAATYNGTSSIILADFVSNARGMSNDVTANTRVNAAGFHKLQGFEAIDLSTSSARQVLTVTATDVNQLSDSNTLEVQLGLNDVLVASGFTSNTRGTYSYNNNWYDQKAIGTVDGQIVTLYSRSGDQAADINSFKKVGTSSLQLNFDHAMVGTPMVGDFSVSGLNGVAVPALSSVSTVNLRQGLSLSFATAVSNPIKVTYSGNLTDEGAGRSVLNKVWMIGTDGSDVMDATSQPQGLTLLGGAGSDLIKGSSFSDVLIGGLGPDTLTGGAGSDAFKYVNEVQGAGAAGGLGGKDGDVITDFNFGRTDESQADRLDLSMLFDSSLAANGDATHDVAQLVDGKFMDIVQTRVTVNGVARKDWEVWVDRDGGGNYQRMVTLQGAGDALPSNYAGNETTSELLQKLLAEGRLTVAHA
jgi:hypothetical protein